MAEDITIDTILKAATEAVKDCTEICEDMHWMALDDTPICDWPTFCATLAAYLHIDHKRVVCEMREVPKEYCYREPTLFDAIVDIFREHLFGLPPRDRIQMYKTNHWPCIVLLDDNGKIIANTMYEPAVVYALNFRRVRQLGNKFRAVLKIKKEGPCSTPLNLSCSSMLRD